MATVVKTRRSPRGEARARAMLEAATDVFIEKGYAAASLDEVIERAGGSRRTLYERFTGKEGLFAAVVQSLITKVLDRMGETDTRDLSVEDELVAVGRTFLAGLLQPRVVAAFRMVIAEIPHFPELGRAFYEAGPATAYARMAARLSDHVAAGRLALDDVDGGARHLLETIKGDLHLQALMCGASMPDDASLERHVRGAVRLFLRGAQARP